MRLSPWISPRVPLLYSYLSSSTVTPLPYIFWFCLTVETQVAFHIEDLLVDVKRQIAEAVTTWNTRYCNISQTQDFEKKKIIDKAELGSLYLESECQKKGFKNIDDTDDIQ